MDSSAAIAECFQRVAPAGSDLYYATLWCDATKRAQIVSLHALVDELVAIARFGNDPGVARIKLAWWNDELSRTLHGGGGHAISVALRATGALAVGDGARMLPLADACAAWLSPHSFPDMQVVETEYRSVEGLLWRQSAILLGANHAETLAAAEMAGFAIGLCDTLQHFKECLRLPTLRLPDDMLAAHGLSADILRLNCGDQAVESFAATIAIHIRQVLASAERALRAEKVTARQLLPLRTMLRLKLATLAEMEADGFAILQRRVVLTPLRKLWIAILCRHRLK